jgi:hypothetical protein
MSIKLGFIPANSTFVIYDLQFVGNSANPTSCYTWNLSALHYHPPQKDVVQPLKNVFDQFVQLPVVNVPQVEHFKLFQVSHEFLHSAGAQTPALVFSYFLKWIASFHDPSNHLFLISHGNFRADKSVIEQELFRARQVLPPNTFFLDTLWLFRLSFPDLQSYSLKSLYLSTTKKQLTKAHLSLFNVYALSDILNHFFSREGTDFKFSGIVYAPYHSPLTRVPSVGLFTENVLHDQGLTCVEDLISVFHQRFSGNAQLFEMFLQNEVMVTASAVRNISSYCSCYFH